MSKSWPMVKLGEVLRHTPRPVTVEPDASYRQIGIRSHGKGVFHKEAVSGFDLGKKKVFWMEPGDFVINIVFGWEGAVAVLGEVESGMIASHRFPTFRTDESRLDTRFLVLFFRTPVGLDLLGRVSPGGAGRNRTLSKNRFLEQAIPLPPLAEQRRIVARIEQLAEQIHEAQRLRKEAAEEAEAMMRSILIHDSDIKLTTMSQLVRLRPPDVTVEPYETYQFAGVYCFGRGVFRAGMKSGMDFAYPRLTRLRKGEFVYPKLMAWEGALGVVPPECDGCVVSTEFPVFEIDEDQVLPEVLDVYFRNPKIWPELAGVSSGTNVRRRRLNPQAFLSYEIPLPSRACQIKLRNTKAEVDGLKRLQAETSAELDALLPAILDRAFKGEL
jgi:type I restriction enzyme, S subunit